MCTRPGRLALLAKEEMSAQRDKLLPRRCCEQSVNGVFVGGTGGGECRVEGLARILNEG